MDAYRGRWHYPLGLPKVASLPLSSTFCILTIALVGKDNRFILKFADDSVSLLHDDEYAHGPVVDEFVGWYENTFLQLNVQKTKDMYIDFRKKPQNTDQKTVIKGQTIDNSPLLVWQP